MPDQTFDSPEQMAEILGESARLRYVLDTHHHIAPADVTAIRIDGDNRKIDIWAGERMVRFKARGTQHVLGTQPGGGMAMALDPALAQAIHELMVYAR